MIRRPLTQILVDQQFNTLNGKAWLAREFACCPTKEAESRTIRSTS